MEDRFGDSRGLQLARVGDHRQAAIRERIMLEAAEGGSISAASEQIERQLFLDMRLDVVKTPA
jgi:hypothetical protein